jgi:hypothetical protein
MQILNWRCKNFSLPCTKKANFQKNKKADIQRKKKDCSWALEKKWLPMTCRSGSSPHEVWWLSSDILMAFNIFFKLVSIVRNHMLSK